VIQFAFDRFGDGSRGKIVHFGGAVRLARIRPLPQAVSIDQDTKTA
jgi:hypothetical protein